MKEGREIEAKGEMIGYTVFNGTRTCTLRYTKCSKWETIASSLPVKWQSHSLFLIVEDSECSRGGQVVEVAWTPPTSECLQVP